MKIQVAKFVAKAVPYVKKVGPVVAAGVGGVFQAITEQKAAERINNLEQRIADLEKLLTK